MQGAGFGEIFILKSIIFFILSGPLWPCQGRLFIELPNIIIYFFIGASGTRNAIIKASLLFSPGKSQSANV